MAGFFLTNERDVFNGSVGVDIVFGRFGDDVLRGRGGDDILRGDAGDDRLIGNQGDDTLEGGIGADILRGGSGEDVLFGGEGDDSLSGGSGADLLDGGAGSDTLDGGGGNDRIIAGEGQDFITTGNGRDTVAFAINLLSDGDVDPNARQVIGGEDFISDFSFGRDTLELDATEFRVFGELSFVSATAANLPSGGANVIVLQDSDDDGDPLTVFNAGSAANLIAEATDEEGAGFFVYFNSALNVNRLVYSEDLSDATADLQIVARFDDLTGDNAIAALQDFSVDDFAFVNEQDPSDAPVDDEVAPGGDVITVDVFDDGARIDADRDPVLNLGRGPVVEGFDPATDTVAFAQGLIDLDTFFDAPGGQDSFFAFTEPNINIEKIAANTLFRLENGGEANDSGVALFYDRFDDTVNVLLFDNLDVSERSFDADVVLEFDVDGQAEGIALIEQLSAANFTFQSDADIA